MGAHRICTAAGTAAGMLAVACLSACAGADPAQEQVTTAMTHFCGALRTALSDPRLANDDIVAIGQHITAGLEPERQRLAPLAPDYEAFSPAQKRQVIQHASARCRSDLAVIYARVQTLSHRYPTPGGEAMVASALRPLVDRWDASGSMWAFELFSPDFVATLHEMVGEGSEEDTSP